MVIETNNKSATRGGRDNNFNFARLVLASLVLISHSSEFMDGDRHREPLTRLFGTLSFGELAVFGFFIISGFLIVKSWQENGNIFHFMSSRVLRIYPAFIAAYFVSLIIVPLIVNGDFRHFALIDAKEQLLRAALLRQPNLNEVFAPPYPGLNSPMWTIAYEFRCYLAVGVLGSIGLLKNRALWLILTILSAAMFQLELVEYLPRIPGSSIAFGDSLQFAKLFSFFAVGGCCYLFRDMIAYRKPWLVLSAFITFVLLTSTRYCHLGVMTAGAYTLLGLCFARAESLKIVRRWPDVSYGLYLYGGPIQKLLINKFDNLHPLGNFVLALLLAAICGYISWHLIEKRFLRLKLRGSAKGTTTTESDGALKSGTAQ